MRNSLRWPLLFVLVFVTTSVASGAGVLHVDDDAPPDGDGTTWGSAYTFLRDALADAEASGGAIKEIRIGPGVYIPDRDAANPTGSGDRGASFDLVAGVMVRGGFAGVGAPDPDERDIDAFETRLSGDLAGDDLPGFVNYDENSYHVVFGSNADGATLDGLTIAGGFANGGGIDADGGGLRSTSSELEISRCTFTANRALVGQGGGLFLSGNGPVDILDSQFLENRAGAGGGGAFIGAGLAVSALRCTFTRNVAVSGGAGGFGGGSNGSGSEVNVQHCVFDRNIAAREGGGLWLSLGTVITHNTFYRNEADRGGGLWVQQTGGFAVVNSLFSGNRANEGGGAHLVQTGSMAFFNCTFVSNVATETGGGMQSADRTAVHSSVFWENSDADGTLDTSQIYMFECCTPIRYSCVQGWTGVLNGIEVIAADPMLVDRLGSDGVAGTPDDDLHLSPGSPCIDTGDPDNPMPVAFDFDGDARLHACRVDMGIDETASVGTDCDANDVTDACDIAHGDAIDCDANGILDSCEDPPPCPANLNIDCLIGTQDLLIVLINWDAKGGPADIDGDGVVDLADLLEVLVRWGPCP